MNDIASFSGWRFAVGFGSGRRAYGIVQQVRRLFLRWSLALDLTRCRSDAVFNHTETRPEGDEHHENADDENEYDLFVAGDLLGSANMSPSFHNLTSSSGETKEACLINSGRLYFFREAIR